MKKNKGQHRLEYLKSFITEPAQVDTDPYETKAAPAIAAITEYIEKNSAEHGLTGCMADLLNKKCDSTYDTFPIYDYVFALENLMVLLTKPSVLKMLPKTERNTIGKSVMEMMLFFKEVRSSDIVQAELDLYGVRNQDEGYSNRLEKYADSYKKDLLAKDTAYEVRFGGKRPY